MLYKHFKKLHSFIFSFKHGKTGKNSNNLATVCDDKLVIENELAMHGYILYSVFEIISP